MEIFGGEGDGIRGYAVLREEGMIFSRCREEQIGEDTFFPRSRRDQMDGADAASFMEEGIERLRYDLRRETADSQQNILHASIPT